PAQENNRREFLPDPFDLAKVPGEIAVMRVSSRSLVTRWLNANYCTRQDSPINCAEIARLRHVLHGRPFRENVTKRRYRVTGCSTVVDINIGNHAIETG